MRIEQNAVFVSACHYQVIQHPLYRFRYTCTPMKIATWNLERLPKRKLDLILNQIREVDADIWVFTETHESMHLGEEFAMVASQALPMALGGQNYRTGEYRVQIFSKYPIIKTLAVTDPYTSVCVDIETPFGRLRVYGTIIGTLGGKKPPFKQQLEQQLADWTALGTRQPLCIAGDLNTIFTDVVYPSYWAIQTLNQAFQELNISNTTAQLQNCVDHIILPTEFYQETPFQIQTWNTDLKLSDHRGVANSRIDSR